MNMLSTAKRKISKPMTSDDALNNLHIDRNFIASTRDNVAAAVDNERRTVPGDKLHRRNPLTVRQQVQPLDDLVPETTLADVQLSEMPGLQNTEQWRRIAARTGQASPPLSRQYYQKSVPILDAAHEQMSEVLGSYRRPGRTENEHDTTTATSSRSKTRRRKTILGTSIAAIIIAIIVGIVVAVVLVQRPRTVTTDYYSGYIRVQATFDPVLLSLSSTLAKNYQREFCSLVSSTLADRKTKYAIFYSTCTVYNFRNGSIIGDFILGFTRYQNVTRLNAFLDRTIINEQLFGGTILAIIFNQTTNVDANDTDYDVAYDNTKLVDITETSSIINQIRDMNLTYVGTGKASSTTKDSTSTVTVNNILLSPITENPFNRLIKRHKPIQHKVILSKKDHTTYQPLYDKIFSTSLTSISSHSKSLDNLDKTSHYLPIFKSTKTLPFSTLGYTSTSYSNQTQ